MEVHHHPIAIGSHTSRKKWTPYLWEFLMLFLAVFCRFLAENQREHITLCLERLRRSLDAFRDARVAGVEMEKQIKQRLNLNK